MPKVKGGRRTRRFSSVATAKKRLEHSFHHDNNTFTVGDVVHVINQDDNTNHRKGLLRSKSIEEDGEIRWVVRFETSNTGDEDHNQASYIEEEIPEYLLISNKSKDELNIETSTVDSKKSNNIKYAGRKRKALSDDVHDGGSVDTQSTTQPLSSDDGAVTGTDDKNNTNQPRRRGRKKRSLQIVTTANDQEEEHDAAADNNNNNNNKSSTFASTSIGKRSSRKGTVSSTKSGIQSTKSTSTSLSREERIRRRQGIFLSDEEIVLMKSTETGATATAAVPSTTTVTSSQLTAAAAAAAAAATKAGNKQKHAAAKRQRVNGRFVSNDNNNNNSSTRAGGNRRGGTASERRATGTASNRTRSLSAEDKKNIIKVPMLTGTLYIYRGVHRRVEFVRHR